MQVSRDVLTEYFSIDSLQETQRAWIYDYIETFIKDGHLLSGFLQQEPPYTEAENSIEIDELSWQGYIDHVFLLINLCAEKLLTTQDAYEFFRNNPQFPKLLIEKGDWVIFYLQINNGIINKLAKHEITCDMLGLALDFLKAPE